MIVIDKISAALELFIPCGYQPIQYVIPFISALCYIQLDKTRVTKTIKIHLFRETLQSGWLHAPFDFSFSSVPAPWKKSGTRWFYMVQLTPPPLSSLSFTPYFSLCLSLSFTVSFSLSFIHSISISWFLSVRSPLSLSLSFSFNLLLCLIHSSISFSAIFNSISLLSLLLCLYCTLFLSPMFNISAFRLENRFLIK